MNRMLSSLCLIFVFTTFMACDDKEEIMEPEVFEDAYEPMFEYNKSDDSYLLKPWNYETESNSNRKYPLLVYLHGRGYDGTPPSFVGYKNSEFKKAHPSFVYMPHSEGQYNVDALINKLTKVIDDYRIDKTRIYVIGYSMGAYWSAPLANKLKDDGVFFAGIISMAGLSNNSAYKPEVLEKSSIWVHIGDKDAHYNRSQELFASIKSYYNEQGAKENTVDINIPDTEYVGTTENIVLRNHEVIKNTVYSGVGHSVSHFPFRNPAVMEWLFKQDTDNR